MRMEGFDQPRDGVMSSPMGMDGDGGYFELRCIPDIALVSSVRCFATQFFDHLINDTDIAHRLAMATHELLENAVAYSPDRRTEIRIALRRAAWEMSVDIQTKNRVVSDRLPRVKVALDEVIAAPDPEMFYQELMRRAAKRKDGGSGLGLGRIRAEADLTFSYDLTGDVLAINARGAFRLRPALRQAK